MKEAGHLKATPSGPEQHLMCVADGRDEHVTTSLAAVRQAITTPHLKTYSSGTFAG